MTVHWRGLGKEDADGAGALGLHVVGGLGRGRRYHSDVPPSNATMPGSTRGIRRGRLHALLRPGVAATTARSPGTAKPLRQAWPGDDVLDESYRLRFTDPKVEEKGTILDLKKTQHQFSGPLYHYPHLFSTLLCLFSTPIHPQKGLSSTSFNHLEALFYNFTNNQQNSFQVYRQPKIHVSENFAFWHRFHEIHHLYTLNASENITKILKKHVQKPTKKFVTRL